MIAVSGVTMVTQTANPVTVVAWGAQMRTLALGPVAVRRMLKVKTVVVANLVSSTCKKIIRKAVRSVSVQEYQTDVRVPTGPMGIFKTCVVGISQTSLAAFGWLPSLITLTHLSRSASVTLRPGNPCLMVTTGVHRLHIWETDFQLLEDSCHLPSHMTSKKRKTIQKKSFS